MATISTYLKNLSNTIFPNKEAISLFAGALVFVVTLYYLIDVVFPILLSAIIAFVLFEPAYWMYRQGIPKLAISLFFLVLLFSIILLFFVFVIPVLWQESLGLLKLLPEVNRQAQTWLQEYLTDIPIIDVQTVNDILRQTLTAITTSTQEILSFSLTSLLSVAWILLYSLLIPILVFFFLYDSDSIIPRMNVLRNKNPLLQTIWTQSLHNLSSYLRGKIIEVVVVSLASYVVLAAFSMTYALFIGIATGVAVLVPYVGAGAVAVFLIVVGLFQWGLEATFFYAMGSYALVQILDAYVLVPLLFSKSLNLRPVTVLLAIIVFAGMWGAWGVLVAIPLVTFIKVVITSWPGLEINEKTV